MHSVVVCEVADRVLTLCCHVFVYLGFPLENNPCNNEEDYGEEHRVDSKLNRTHNGWRLTRRAKILSAVVKIGSINMKLKRSIMATDIDPILTYELIPSSVAISFFEKKIPT